MIVSISRAIGSKLADYLSKAQPGYRRHDTVSIDEIAGVIKTGDIVLVEGNTRISTAIKYLTQSSWSHACLWVGSEAEGPDGEQLLEADLTKGVRMVNLKHYAEFNLRICRPVNLSDEDKIALVNFAKAKLGQTYDLKNIIDLLRYIIQKPPVPNRFRRSMLAIGSGEPTKVICSTLIAESFQSINYPILPMREGEQGADGEVPQFYRRHFTHFTPRDFDLSPYFEVVKPSLVKGFDYKNVNWNLRDADSDLKS